MTEHINLYYLDHDRTPLLCTIREVAAHHEDLDVTVQQIEETPEYEERFLGGELDVICEHSRFLFPARLQGHPVRLLSACQRGENKLLAAEGINSTEDLYGKTIAIRATPSTRISGTYWMRRLGLEERSTLIYVDDREVGRWQQWRKVASGEAQAVISTPLYEDEAFAAGLHHVDVPPLPQVGQIVLAALGPFVTSHDEAVRRLIRSLYRAIDVFRNQPDEAMRIMGGEPSRLMRTKIESEADLRKQYERLRASIGPSAIPSPEAIQVEYELLDQGYVPLAGLNPLTLWDLHYAIDAEESSGIKAV